MLHGTRVVRDRGALRRANPCSLVLVVLDEIVHHREVLVGEPLRHQRTVDLVGQGSERNRRVGAGGHGRRNAEILCDEPGRETARVSVGGRSSRDDAGDGVVHLRGPAAAGRSVDNVGEHLRIKSEADGQIHALGQTAHRDAQHHVIAHLGRLAHAVPAAVRNLLSHALQQLLHRLVLLGRTPDHERKRGILRPGDTTGHGSIDERRSGSFHLFLDLRSEEETERTLSHPLFFFTRGIMTPTALATFGSIVLESMKIVWFLMPPPSMIVSYVLATISLFGSIVTTKSDALANSATLSYGTAPFACRESLASFEMSNTCNLCPCVEQKRKAFLFCNSFFKYQTWEHDSLKQFNLSKYQNNP
uniref:Uncharacterized protein n=1 Tax=Anopheles atroparvus TaxID=41427 RepID=A0AAG5D8N0_ANOAO